jgi:CBS domain-containing protein
LIVEENRLLGIITDRDIRSRVVALGLDVNSPVAEVMTEAPITVDINASLFDAMMLMSEKAIHHLPVVEGQQPVSVLTTSDLVRSRQRDPVYLLQAISRVSTLEDLVLISKELPALVLRLVSEGARAHQVSHILCTISDQVTRQLIQLAEAKLGAAPVPYAWLAFGSQGRREIALGGDQDNALVIDDSLKPEDEPYFESLARFVCDGLNACGYPYCPGNVMATNDAWRLRLQDWKNTVSSWVRSPTDDAVMRVSIFFDIRPVTGDQQLSFDLHQHMLKTASANSIFLAAVARNALCNRPPLGFFRRFVVERNGEHQDMLDLKHRGIIPVVDMARVHAIANQVVEVNTRERLSALADKKVLALKDQRNLQDALDFVMQIRLQHQCERIRAGEATDNFVNPQALGSLARKQLRDAFSIIHDGQVTVSSSFSAGTF